MNQTEQSMQKAALQTAENMRPEIRLFLAMKWLIKAVKKQNGWI